MLHLQRRRPLSQCRPLPPRQPSRAFSGYTAMGADCGAARHVGSCSSALRTRGLAAAEVSTATPSVAHTGRCREQLKHCKCLAFPAAATGCHHCAELKGCRAPSDALHPGLQHRQASAVRLLVASDAPLGQPTLHNFLLPMQKGKDWSKTKPAVDAVVHLSQRCMQRRQAGTEDAEGSSGIVTSHTQNSVCLCCTSPQCRKLPHN